MTPDRTTGSSTLFCGTATATDSAGRHGSEIDAHRTPSCKRRSNFLPLSSSYYVLGSSMCNAAKRLAGRRLSLFGHRARHMIALMLLQCYLVPPLVVNAFAVGLAPAAVDARRRRSRIYRIDTNSILLTSNTKLSLAMENDDDTNEEENEEEEQLGDEGVVIEDLDWRVEKLRLEEQNTRRFLKAKPRFLPYEDCRQWVQAWGQRWETKEDWRNWIAMGEKRNSYIPSKPDDYYTSLGEWKGWAHFLGCQIDVDDQGFN